MQIEGSRVRDGVGEGTDLFPPDRDRSSSLNRSWPFVAIQCPHRQVQRTGACLANGDVGRRGGGGRRKLISSQGDQPIVAPPPLPDPASLRLHGTCEGSALCLRLLPALRRLPRRGLRWSAAGTRAPRPCRVAALGSAASPLPREFHSEIPRVEALSLPAACRQRSDEALR